MWHLSSWPAEALIYFTLWKVVFKSQVLKEVLKYWTNLWLIEKLTDLFFFSQLLIVNHCLFTMVFFVLI